MGRWWNRWLTPVVIGTAVTVGVLTADRARWLEPFELRAYDHLVQLQPDRGPDPRLLIVAFTEADIRALKQVSPTDDVLTQVLKKLAIAKPRVIGIDFFRDQPIGQSNTHFKTLTQYLKTHDRLIPVCERQSPTSPGVAPPPNLPGDRVGFADIPEDPDGTIRRYSLLMSPDPEALCSTPYSFGLQVGLYYLEAHIPQNLEDNTLTLGSATFRRMPSHAGGYVNVDTYGFQLPIHFRSRSHIARQVSFQEVLNNQVNPHWIKDKAVLIGTTAPSKQDIRNTPYSSGQQDSSGKMAGVAIHAQVTSQVLSAVYDGQRPMWFWAEWGEWVWVWGWSLVGGGLAWRLQHPLRLGGANAGAIALLVGGCVYGFSQAGWIPMVAPAIGLIGSSVSALAYQNYASQKAHRRIAEQAQAQEETIRLLQDLIQQNGSLPTRAPTLLDRPQRDRVLNQRYRITELLGSGGFGHTYIAQDIQRPTHPLCVVKHLQPARNDERFLTIARRLFRTEADILELLGKHPQIPQLLAYFEEQSQFYLVQEYIPGHPLVDEIYPGQRWSEAQVVALLRDVLPILSFVHQHQVIHRDIKPSNLMRRDRDQRIILIDFGAVKQLQPQVTQALSTIGGTSTVTPETIAVGTPGYTPPEQMMGHPQLNSDLYGLGMICVEALTGASAQTFQHDPQTGQFVWQQFANVSPEFAAILNRMVHYDGRSRYQSSLEVLRAIDTLLN